MAAVDDGVAAVEAIGARLPALVVLDLSLPAVGGLDILRWMRGSEEVRPGDP